MDKERTKTAVLFIVRKAQEKHFPLGKTRLIKLLYLLDVESYRYRHDIYTGASWVFYKYGPFSFELDGLLGEIGIEEKEIPLDSSRFMKKVSLSLEEIDIVLDIEAKSIIERLLEEWGDADLNELLDYVYFDTEPMFHAKYKSQLSFSSIKGAEKERAILLSEETIKNVNRLCIRIRSVLEAIKIPEQIQIVFPSGVSESLMSWGEEPQDMNSLKGKVRIDSKNES